MNKEEKAQAIEAKIREVCPELQELSFGCAIKAKNYQKIEDAVFISKGSYKNDGGFRLFDIKKQNEVIDEIIGHPVHLEHLLRTTSQAPVGSMWNWRTVGPKLWAHSDGPYYDLTLSFSDNMKNEQLVDFLYSIV